MVHDTVATHSHEYHQWNLMKSQANDIRCLHRFVHSSVNSTGGETFRCNLHIFLQVTETKSERETSTSCMSWWESSKHRVWQWIRQSNCSCRCSWWPVPRSTRSPRWRPEYWQIRRGSDRYFRDDYLMTPHVTCLAIANANWKLWQKFMATICEAGPSPRGGASPKVHEGAVKKSHVWAQLGENYGKLRNAKPTSDQSLWCFAGVSVVQPHWGRSFPAAEAGNESLGDADNIRQSLELDSWLMDRSATNVGLQASRHALLHSQRTFSHLRALYYGWSSTAIFI